MGDHISLPGVLFVLFVLAVFFTLFAISSYKKHKLAELAEKNKQGLSSDATALLQSCSYRDAKWVEEYGTSLDAQDLVDPLEIAIDSGWRAMDHANDVLIQGDFASNTALLSKFLDLLNEASKQFDIADKLTEEFAKEVEG